MVLLNEWSDDTFLLRYASAYSHPGGRDMCGGEMICFWLVLFKHVTAVYKDFWIGSLSSSVRVQYTTYNTGVFQSSSHKSKYMYFQSVLCYQTLFAYKFSMAWYKNLHINKSFLNVNCFKCFLCRKLRLANQHLKEKEAVKEKAALDFNGL